MTHKSHIAFALAITIPLTIVLRNVGFIETKGVFVLFFLTVIISTLAPDIDHEKSILSQIFPFISRFIRKYTEHRGFTHKPISIILSTIFVLVLFYKIPVIAFAWFVGYSLHIIADGMTVSGIQKFFKQNTFYTIPNKMRFKTGSEMDNKIFFMNLLLIFSSIIYINNFNLLHFS
jgi:inner membrane protein